MSSFASQYLVTMISNFKAPLNKPSLRPTILSFFRTEESSNNYISSLCKQNLYREAFEAFDFLQKNTRFEIKLSTYAHLINACSSLRSVEHGRKIHSHILTSKCQPDFVIHNHLLNMYGKCGALKDARKVFDEMPHRNAVSWTSMIAGYSQTGQEKDAIILFFEMLQKGFNPDHFTFGNIIKACSRLGIVGLGRQLHGHVMKLQFGSDVIAQNALIAMYTKFDQIEDAWKVFSHIKMKDLISWGSMITGFCQLGYELEALHLLKEMLSQGAFQPNESIFPSAFSSCSSLLQPEYGRQIHGLCVKFGLGGDNFAGCSLCDMYARCGFLGSARKIFDQIERPDLASWNAIIAGVANGGDANEAISFFSQMRQLGLFPNNVTLRSLLCSCASPLTLHQGMLIHSYIIKVGFGFNVPVCNALVTMYTKCSNFCNAYNVFEQMINHADSVSWNLILTACLQHNQSGEVFRLFKLMLLSKVKPDQTTLSNLLAACKGKASLEMGNQLHCYITKTGLVLEASVMNGLIDMFTKCGFVESAEKIFDLMENPDVVSWSSLIMGYAQFGYAGEALKLFRTMRNLGVKPNQITLLGVLTACSYVGLVEEGWQLYRTMETEYGIAPTKEHSSCVVDLLARAGYLYEAEGLTNNGEFDPDIVAWKTLLAASKMHGNVDIGKRAAENILKIDPTNSAAHVLLCNIYASSGNWGDVARLRSLMKQRGVRKVPGQSCIEVKDKIHTFFAKDSLHPERDKIYSILEELWLQMLDDGYISSQQ